MDRALGRPRIHDEDAVLDAAEELLGEGGGALTIRSLAARTGASSGSLYHAFGSRSELVGRLWLRGAQEFLARQAARIEAAEGDGVAAVTAAALTLSELARERPATARLLIDHRRDELLGGDLPAVVEERLRALDAELLRQLKQLARVLTGRADRRGVDLVTLCVVDLPAAFLSPRHDRVVDPEPLLEAAVAAVLARATTH